MHRTYSVEEKLNAVAEYLESGSYRATARKLGISMQNIRRWEALLEAGKLYDCPVKARREEEAALEVIPRDPAELPDDPEELKRIIFEQQFEIDLMRAVVDVVKKRPPRRPVGPGEQGEGGGDRRDAPDVFSELFGV